MSDAPLTNREKVFAVVFAIVATAILIELGFRMLGPTQSGFNNETAEYPSNPRGYLSELRVENGRPIYGVAMDERVGLGGRLGPREPSVGVPIILGMGDSQAQGQGVRFADTMYARLEVLLADQGTERHIRNVAVSGYDLDEIAARYAYEARDADQFELVLYTMVLDDFGLDRKQIAGSAFIAPQSVDTPDEWRTRSAAWNFVSHIADRWTLSKQTTTAYLNGFRGENLAKRTEQLRRLASQVREDGAELVVIVMPLLYDFENYPFAEIHQTMNDFGHQSGIPVLDILPVLQPFRASDLWVHDVDHHPNEMAHEKIAVALHQFLQEKQLIKSSLK